ncbi:hypothetical protein TTRE_0000543501 [Trichuris trichiura]|uniref:SH2 domain-containing protein n=1 Tax=Trichuris trichiura TaxID=36087 RepID=A0A077ZCB7_TRITR|nr:hypothetical protein TTRE_0000543501 [Trichuris trichiura]
MNDPLVAARWLTELVAALYDKKPQRNDLPPCPVEYLPYFHGCLSMQEAERRLERPNDFLIFLNKTDDLKPTVLVKADNGENCQVPIQRNDCGVYWIDENDIVAEYRSIEPLIRSYAFTNKKLESDQKLLCRLSNPVYAPEVIDCVKLEQSETLSYQYSQLEEEKLIDVLRKDGDFLLQVDPTVKSRLLLRIMWNKTARSIPVRLNSANQLYPLPYGSVDEPIEHVDCLDELVKSHVRCQIPLKGALLRTPIAFGKYDQRGIGENAIKNENTVPTEEMWQAVKRRNEAGSRLRSWRAPRPLQCLPYYHGTMFPEEAEDLLKFDGQFLLYSDKSNGALMVAACKHFFGTETKVHREIRKSSREKYFYIKSYDKKLKYTTAEDLVLYYLTYSIPLEGNDKALEKRTNESVIFNEPVVNLQLARHVLLEPVANMQDLMYCYSSIDDETANRLLRQEGDYLLRVQCNGQLLISVKWDGQVHNLDAPESNDLGMYTLPRSDASYPPEEVSNLDEYVKSMVVHQIPWRGVVLRRAITKTEIVTC